MSRLFGTDGVRGVANQELTPDLAYKLGKAGAYVLGRHEEELEATDDICYVYGRNITYFCHNIPKE
jgi:phosphomannomutase